MARIKHKDMNPIFDFEYSVDVENSVLKILDAVSIKDRLNSSIEILNNGDKRLIFEVSDSKTADIFSYVLSEFRKDFYGLNNLNKN